MDFQQSQTYKNLQTAYDWEVSVSTTYSIYGDTARQEGYIQIGDIFDRVVRNEKEHARIWLRQINDGTLPNTEESLQRCAQMELYSGNEMYRDFARVAIAEVYNDLAALFNGVANIELNHNSIFTRYLNDIQTNQVFCKDQQTTLWVCMQCGNILSGLCAPEICPVCGFPQGYYRLYDSNID